MPEIIILNSKPLAEPKMGYEETKKCAGELRSTLYSLFGQHIDERTGCINYITLSRTPEFRDFIEKTQKLPSCQPQLLEEPARKTFFIMAHLHSKKSLGDTLASPIDIPDFWNSYAYQIGNFTLTLDEMEHGLLRANRMHPSSKQPIFGESDNRLELALTSVDSRIHFALNCGAKSCPAVKVYSESNLDEILDNASRAYLQAEVSIKKDDKFMVNLPQILEWYAEDFGGSIHNVLRWIAGYMEGSVKELLNEILSNRNFDECVEINYAYDWSINHQDSFPIH